MSNNLTDECELGLLGVLQGTAYAVTTPLKCQLMTEIGNESTPGTEVEGGDYAAVTITMSAPASGQMSNTDARSVSGMPTCTVVGVEIWDSSATPKRLMYSKDGEFTERDYQAGDIATIAVGAIVLSLD